MSSSCAEKKKRVRAATIYSNGKAQSKKREAAGHPAFESELRNPETGVGTTVFSALAALGYLLNQD